MSVVRYWNADGYGYEAKTGRRTRKNGDGCGGEGGHKTGTGTETGTATGAVAETSAAAEVGTGTDGAEMETGTTVGEL